MHKLFQNIIPNWRVLESQIELINNKKEKGDVFEEFVYFYLTYHGDLYQLKEMYSPVVDHKPFPTWIRKRLKLESYDHGVDGVYITFNDKMVAYQAKFRSNRISPPAKELSSFWAEAEYADYRSIIANSYRLPQVASKKANHLSILVDRFNKLDSAFFKALYDYAKSKKIIKKEKFKPRDYQKKMLKGIIRGFENSDRGKLIAACGTGKTLVSLWVAERLNCNRVLFLAPNLALIRQTLESWVKHRNTDFSYLCVCSDQTVSSNVDDEIILNKSEVDIPVTTSANVVKDFLLQGNGKKIVFSTYQSLEVISEALSEKKDNFFNITFFDEAHRTAGVGHAQLFSIGLDDINVPSEKRLFMTATERLVKPRIKGKLEGADRIFFSMDDESVYGPVFAKLNFGDAIKRKIVSDYRIILAGILDKEVYNLIEKNRYVIPEENETDGAIAAEDVFKGVLLLNVIKEVGISKIVSFHSFIKNARLFLEIFKTNAHNLKQNNMALSTVFGDQSSAERAEIFDNFEDADFGLLANVRCLTEGVDIPLIDSIFFSDPRNSMIDIVQAVGRALRQPYGNTDKVAYIILPILINEDSDSSDILNQDHFETVHSVIQALRDQDNNLAEWIDEINLQTVKGKSSKKSFRSGKIKILMPIAIDIDELREKITLRIAEVNKDPFGTTKLGGKLGKKERISTYKRIFKTLGDYNPEPYYTSLVKPTINKFSIDEEILKRSFLKINNNNVSHTERLGVIKKIESNSFILTSLGKLLKANKIDFNLLFKNQMLLYSINTEDGLFYPYRASFELMKEISSLTYIEFLFGLYSIKPAKNVWDSIGEVIKRISWIRSEFPNVELTSVSNQDSVMEALNSTHPVGFKKNDIWTDRTTTGNQFRYFIRHLELFDDVFSSNWKTKIVRVKNGAEKILDDILLRSDPKEKASEQFYGELIWIN